MNIRFAKTLLSGKRQLLFIIFFCLACPLYAQQFALYNSRTLYDSFENPSQSPYQIDTSRRIAFNAFLPTLSVNATFSGPAGPAIKSLVYDGVFNGRDITLGENQLNTLTINTNNYIIMLRILRKVKKSEEIGLSWQIRDDARIRVTNETLAIFDDYRVFSGEDFTNLFNNKAYNQSYHQFSLTYRRNETKRLSIGLKASILSGISYSRINITQSNLQIDEVNDAIDVSLAGTYRTNFKMDNFETKNVIPGLRNPGLAFSAGASYKIRNGWFLLGNLKDIGFIKWSKKSFEYAVNTGPLTIENASDESSDDRLSQAIEDEVNETVPTSRSYLSTLNGKMEVLLNKDFGNYQPNLIVSKSLFYGGGNVVLANNYRFKSYVFTLTGDYNMNNFLQVGTQLMIKNPNTEFFIGSDNIFKTAAIIKNSGKMAYPYSTGHSAASFYMGFGFKFGRVLEHPANSSSIPGFDREDSGGLFNIFKKKKKQED